MRDCAAYDGGVMLSIPVPRGPHRRAGDGGDAEVGENRGGTEGAESRRGSEARAFHPGTKWRYE